jgi:hypothetical protein
MPIVGIVLKNISASKNADIEGSVKVNNNTNLKDVKETNLAVLGKKGLSVGFEFKTIYEAEKLKKSFGEVSFIGDVLIVDDKHKEILDGWKKNKKLPDQINIAVINTVLRRCLTEGLLISEKLNLPPPVVLPFATEKQPEESRYIG